MDDARSSRSRAWVGVGLLAACTANPPPPPPTPEAPPETPPAVVEAPPVEPPPGPPPPAEPPVALLPATTLALQPVLVHHRPLAVAELPSGHVLAHDDQRFVVLPARGPLEPPTLRRLPDLVLRQVDPELFDGENQATLETLHGAWPDLLYATTEYTEARASKVRSAWHWQGDDWVEEPTAFDGGSFGLSMTYERFMPWVKGSYLVERGLSCTSGCPEDGIGDEFDESEIDVAYRRERRKRAREISRKLDRHKPLAVMGGRATSLPALPDDAMLGRVIATPTGDLWVPRRSGAVDRWNLAQKTWQGHTLPEGRGRFEQLVGTRAGAAYYARCEPSLLVRLAAGAVTPVRLPDDRCVRHMVVDREDTLWIVTDEPFDAAQDAPATIWRSQGEAWQRVDLAPVSLPGGAPVWVSDGVAWEQVSLPAGMFTLEAQELLAFGPGDVWVHGRLPSEHLHVLVRESAGVTPVDLRTAESWLVASCPAQSAELGKLPAGVEPAQAWPGALRFLRKLGLEDSLETEPRLYEVDEDGERVFYVVIVEPDTSARERHDAGLTAALPDAGSFECGLPPQPVREHELDAADEPGDDPPEAPAKPGEPDATAKPEPGTTVNPGTPDATVEPGAGVKPVEPEPGAQAQPVEPTTAKPAEPERR
jgi:hypothetical protein